MQAPTSSSSPELKRPEDVPHTDHRAAIEAFGRLLRVMDELRTLCPWDRKQTIESIRHLSIEEVYELSDAILAGDWQELKKESGDLLLHIVFYARMASEHGHFTMAEVIESLIAKLIRRHPHIYADVTADDAQTVTQNWEAIKQLEKNERGELPKGVLDGVPSSLPALLKAYRMQEKAAAVGFDWPELGPVKDKVEEELAEVEEALASGHQSEAEAEFGDLLFSLVNYARHLGLNPEDALARAGQKFRRRFEAIEVGLRQVGKRPQEATLDEMEALWQAAKRQES